MVGKLLYNVKQSYFTT